MNTFRLILWGLVGLAAAGMAAFLLIAPKPQPMPVSEAPSDSIQASIGGPFTLVGSDGEPFSSTRLAGRPYAIFFGFTHCPDVCPTTLARLVNLREAAGGRDAFDIVFVTVDPDRDGPDEMGRYSGLFDTPIIGLTGSQAQIDKVKDAFGVFSKKDPGDPENYNVQHTATVFLMGKDGKFVSTIAPEEGRDSALAKVERIAS